MLPIATYMDALNITHRKTWHTIIVYNTLKCVENETARYDKKDMISQTGSLLRCMKYVHNAQYVDGYYTYSNNFFDEDKFIYGYKRIYAASRRKHKMRFYGMLALSLGQYSRMSQAMWVILVPPVYRINITFVEFYVPSYHMLSCSSHSVKVYDEQYMDNGQMAIFQLGVYCGVMEVFSVFPTSNKAYVEYTGIDYGLVYTETPLVVATFQVFDKDFIKSSTDKPPSGSTRFLVSIVSIFDHELYPVLSIGKYHCFYWYILAEYYFFLSWSLSLNTHSLGDMSSVFWYEGPGSLSLVMFKSQVNNLNKNKSVDIFLPFLI